MPEKGLKEYLLGTLFLDKKFLLQVFFILFEVFKYYKYFNR